MTEKDLLYKLRRGLGRAIFELQENPDRAGYGDIVLRCCLKNIGYPAPHKRHPAYIRRRPARVVADILGHAQPTTTANIYTHAIKSAAAAAARYEDLDTAYRGRLIPDIMLLEFVNKAKKSIDIGGGIRFLPIYGQSGAGKSCAAIEISTHMPTEKTFVLSRDEIES